MINTIFWFADNIDQYNHELTTQGISDKTIVFIKDSGEIYVNNKKYGRTLEDIFNDPKVDTIFNDDSVLKQQVQDMIDALRRDHNHDIALVIETINTNKNTQSSDKNALNDKIDNTKTAVDGRVDGVIEELNAAKTNINSRIDDVEQDITDINTTLDYVSDRTLVANAGLNINSVGTPSITVTKDAVNNREILTFNYLKGEPGTPGSTGKKGDKGDKGDKGNPGNDGHSPTVEIRNGYWYIDGVNTGVKAKGEDGTTPTVDPYDDTEIRGKIQEILDELEDLQNNPGGSSGSGNEGGLTAEDLARIEELESNVGELQRTVDALELSSGGMTEDEINGFIENAISNSTTLLELIREHGIDGIANWSGWDNKLQSYLQGYVAGLYTDENGSYNITLSELVQKVNQIKNLVDAVSVLVDENGQPVSLETIQTMINQSIEGNTSISEIKNKYAFKKDDVIKWMGSGFESSVSPTTSFAQMYANGLSTVNENITSATSGLRSEITNDINGLVSGAIGKLISNYSNGNITTLSGLVVKANNSISEADMVASINNGTSQAHSAVKATADASFVTNFASYKSDVERISSISNKADATSAAISGIVDASTNTVTASKIWSTLANNDSVKSAMKSEFATTVDGEGIASIVKEDIAQDFEQTSWDAYVTYMKGGIANITGLTSTVNANQAAMESFAAYATDLDALKNDSSHITALSIASKIANSTEAVNTLSAKFKPTSQEIATAVETKLNASADGGNWTSFAQQIAADHTSLGSLSTRVGTLEGKDFVESTMFALITDVNGNINGASIIAAVNNDGSSVTIDADKIDIGGVTILPNQVKDSSGNTLPNIITTAIAASTIKASQITSGKITASLIDSTNLNVNAANIRGTLTTSQITGSTIADAVNNASDDISINADRINFDGYAVFTNLGFKDEIYDILDDEYDIGAISTTAGNAATAAASAAKVVNTIYRSSNSSSSPSLPSLFVTDTTGSQGIWTTVRPEYNANYPYLFKSTQTKKTDDTATFSPAYLDKTTTVIDGSHITTGTISADRIDTSTLVAKNVRTTNSNNTVTNSINSDGSGMIASGGIQWTTTGGLTLSQTFLASLFQALGAGASLGLSYKGITESIYDDTADYGDATTNATVINKRSHIYAPNINNGEVFPTIHYCPITDPTYSVPVTSKTDAVDWYLSAMYANKLNFINGILSTKDKVDKYTHLTRAEMIADTNYNTNIAEHIYKETSILESDSVLLNKVLEFMGSEFPGQSGFLGYLNNVTWTITAMTSTSPYKCKLNYNASVGSWAVVNVIEISAGASYTTYQDKFMVVKCTESGVWKVYKNDQFANAELYTTGSLVHENSMMDRYFFKKYNPWS